MTSYYNTNPNPNVGVAGHVTALAQSQLVDRTPLIALLFRLGNRRGTARRPTLVETLLSAAQLYEKLHLKRFAIS